MGTEGNHYKKAHLKKTHSYITTILNTVQNKTNGYAKNVIKYGPNSMRNAIQHVRHHIATRNQTNKAEWQEWANEEIITRDCRIRTLRNHNPWKEIEPKKENGSGKQPQETQNEHIDIDKNETPSANKENIWERLGYIKQIINSAPQETHKETIWKCQINECTETNKIPDNLAKHLAKTHPETMIIKLSRQKVYFPLCNISYSNAIALLMHLQMTETGMTWKPMKCEIITSGILSPNKNTNK